MRKSAPMQGRIVPMTLQRIKSVTEMSYITLNKAAQHAENYKLLEIKGNPHFFIYE